MELIHSFVIGVIDDPELNGGNIAKGTTGDSSMNIAKSAFGKLPRISGSLKSLASDTIKNTAGTANAFASQVKGPWKNARSFILLVDSILDVPWRSKKPDIKIPEPFGFRTY
jgi:hypothetical protein